MQSFFLGLSIVGLSSGIVGPDRFAARIVDPLNEPITFHLKDDSGQVFGNIGSLKGWMERRKKTVRFAMNGGDVHAASQPGRSFIEDGKDHPEDRSPNRRFGELPAATERVCSASWTMAAPSFDGPPMSSIC